MKSPFGRGMPAGAAAVMILAAVTSGGASAAERTLAGDRADRASLLDTGKDIVMERAFVPSADSPQGEVRIVRRGGHAVVQTLPYTRVPRRVFASIGQKERRNWPADTEGHLDMERYVAALEKFRRGVAARPSPDGAKDERRVNVLIEFIDAPGAPLVAIGGVEIEGTGDAIRIRKRAAPAVLELSAGYVARNMRFIVADSFHLSDTEAAARLAAAAGS